MLKKKTIKDRFTEKIEIIPEHTCHEWIGAKAKSGYGMFSITHGNAVLAHRFIFELNGIKIEDGKHIDHICRNRGCVNLVHLRQVTPKQNALFNSDSVSAKNHVKTHCSNGHEYNEENTLYCKQRIKFNRRFCRVCNRANARKINARNKDKSSTKATSI